MLNVYALTGSRYQEYYLGSVRKIMKFEWHRPKLQNGVEPQVAMRQSAAAETIKRWKWHGNGKMISSEMK
jgi:hypothetical protein